MPKTILVVDDDPVFLADLSELLNAASYITVPVKDGRAALLALRTHKGAIDAAIIDLDLPEIGGFHIIGELTKGAATSPIPLLAITGAYKDVYLEVAEYLGARASVRKPDPGEPLTPIVDAFNLMMMNAEHA